MKLSEVIKELQALEAELGGDTTVNAYMYGEITDIKWIGVRCVYNPLGADLEVFIEGPKYHDE